MLNRVNKGGRTELLAKKELEHEGWQVYKKIHTRYSPGDIFGCYDLFCVKGNESRLIQIKSDMSDFYKARKKIAKWKVETGVSVPCEVWCYLGRGQWKQEVIS